MPRFIRSFDAFVTQSNCNVTAAAYINFLTDALKLHLEGTHLNLDPHLGVIEELTHLKTIREVSVPKCLQIVF